MSSCEFLWAYDEIVHNLKLTKTLSVKEFLINHEWNVISMFFPVAIIILMYEIYTNIIILLSCKNNNIVLRDFGS